MTEPPENGKRPPVTDFPALSVQAVLGRVSFLLVLPTVLALSFMGAPKILYSYRTAHFAAMYVLGLATMAAFKDWSFVKLFWRLTGFVTLVGLARTAIHHHPETNFFDWVADMGGVLGALVPSLVQRYRDAFAPRR